jgi:hypothetical protein
MLYFCLNGLSRGSTVKLSASTLSRQGCCAMVPSGASHLGSREQSDAAPESMKRKLVTAATTVAAIVAKATATAESYHECSNVVEWI